MDLAFITPFQGILVLIIVGFLLVAAEVYVPGMILGILGAILLMVAVGWSCAAYGLVTGAYVAAGVGAFTMMGFVVWIFAFPKTYFGRKLINTDRLPAHQDSARDALLGCEGETLTALRPSGVARVAGRRLDVVADAAFIEADTPIIVTQVEGNRVVVRKKL